MSLVEFMLTPISVDVSEDGVYRVMFEGSTVSVQRKNMVHHGCRSVYSQLCQLITNEVTDTSKLPRSRRSFKQARSNTNVWHRMYEQFGSDITQRVASYAMAPSKGTGITMYLRCQFSGGIIY